MTPHDRALDQIAAHTRMLKRLNAALTPHGISVSEYLVLHELGGAPERMMRRVDLAERVGLSPSGVARMLKPMEKIGLVAKGEAGRDARVSPVCLTDAGERILGEARVAFSAAAGALLAN